MRRTCKTRRVALCRQIGRRAKSCTGNVEKLFERRNWPWNNESKISEERDERKSFPTRRRKTGGRRISIERMRERRESVSRHATSGRLVASYKWFNFLIQNGKGTHRAATGIPMKQRRGTIKRVEGRLPPTALVERALQTSAGPPFSPHPPC